MLTPKIDLELFKCKMVVVTDVGKFVDCGNNDYLGISIPKYVFKALILSNDKDSNIYMKQLHVFGCKLKYMNLTHDHEVLEIDCDHVIIEMLKNKRCIFHGYNGDTVKLLSIYVCGKEYDFFY